jgi:Arc/MetJ-type ribon-helix-helix transcriptional regulator
MKVRLSLPRRDIAFLDQHTATHASPSRSAVIREAIDALRLRDLEDAYRDAWDEWTESGEADIWRSV